MAFNQALAERIRQQLARRRNVEEMKLFGCVGFLVHGNMLVGVWKDSLIVRLGLDSYEDALLEPHVKEFNITGRPMKGWVLIEPEGVEGDDQLAGWIGRATKSKGYKRLKLPPVGLEPTACCLEGSCSIQLSYGGKYCSETVYVISRFVTFLR
jgi:TfoX N-terminal domain